jgi:translation initiation factor IF-3
MNKEPSARVNDQIRVPRVRLIGPDGEQIGVVATPAAVKIAQDAGLDLVEVAAAADPPVAKIMDYGKFRYEQSVRDRESRKKQAQNIIKEMKLRPKIDSHDYRTKLAHVQRFLNGGDQVKVTVMFRGREQSRPEQGLRLLQQLAADVADLGRVITEPKQYGRDMTMVLAPLPARDRAAAAAAREPS